MNLHTSMNRCRLASRELFNHYFAVADSKSEDAFAYYDGFNEVERVLFTVLVLDPCSVPTPTGNYLCGVDPHPSIRVRLPIANAGENLVGSDEPMSAPIMINREIDSGSWDFPVERFSNDATLLFICFFDRDSMSSRDNAYVRVMVSDWPSHPEAVGMHALVETNSFRYVLTDTANSVKQT